MNDNYHNQRFADVRDTMEMMRRALESSAELNSNIAYGCITLIHKQLLDVPQESLHHFKEELRLIQEYVQHLRRVIDDEKDYMGKHIQQINSAGKVSRAYNKSSLKPANTQN